MGRTFIRQDAQIASSLTTVGGFVDNTAPASTMESGASTILDDLNNIRSLINYQKDLQGGDWYDVLVAPSALEAGAIRGIDQVNVAVHALEKKRVLRSVRLLDDVGVTASGAATATLTSAVIPANLDTVTIGSKTYTFETSLTDSDGFVAIGGSQAQAMENLRRAIMGDGVAGTNYGTGTPVNTDVSAIDTATTIVATALAEGTQGNLIATAEASTDLSWSGPTFLTGGVGGDVEILGAGELPTQTTAAVAAVTTLGTVVDPAAAFGTAGLDEVAGSHALAPKNLVELVDGSTGDPILTTGVGESPSGKRVWGLLQGESGLIDGDTITDTTDNRVQISFVIANATNDDLVLVDGEEMGGKTINYSYRERIRLEDLVEGDFLNTAAIDIGAGAVSPTRQLSYDNQGVTPVDVTTNSTLDLEGPGLTWSIRDDLEAMLFQIVEGSAGGTSQVNLGSDVDEFDVDAALNNFAQGVSIASGKTRPIDVGVNDGIIESTAGALEVQATTTLSFDDGNKPGGWSLAEGIHLSDAAQEWTDLEANAGSEVSLLQAINLAFTNNTRTKVQAILQSNVAADTDVNGPGTPHANTDVDLAPYDSVPTSFVADVEVFLNGELLRNAANDGGGEDVYPGGTPAAGDLKFQFALRGTGANPDQLTVIANGQ